MAASPHAQHGPLSHDPAGGADGHPAPDGAGGRPWLLACLWLAVLGPGFFLFYGGANQYAASLPPAQVGVLVWDWERHIPFLPWTIVPYWSIDLMYGLSLFLCASRAQLHTHAQRMLLTLLLSCAFFVAFPLRFSFGRPEVEGVFGLLFAQLRAFDAPFNQAPSLHISLLVLLWCQFRRALPRRWLPLLHGWCILIALSVLTTWQHHFIDVPTGAALGVLVCLLLPMPEYRQYGWHPADAARARQLGTRYGLAGLGLLLPALFYGGWVWLLLWPAVAALWLAWAYLRRGPQLWQKLDGRHSLASYWVLAPVRLLIQAVQAWLRRGLPPAQALVPGVWLGSVRDASDARFTSVLDLSCEYALRVPANVVSLPLLDLMLPNAQELEQAARHIDTLRERGPVLVCCALGLTRSAAVCLYWQVSRGHAPNVASAWAALQHMRPQVVLPHGALMALDGHLQQVLPAALAQPLVEPLA